MSREIIKNRKRTKESFAHIDDQGGEGGAVIKESPLEEQSHWPDYSLQQMSPAPEQASSKPAKSSPKKKR
jgi:hypothetical protein